MKSFFYIVIGVIGLILCFCGVLVGLYMGIMWAFIGGIVMFIEAARATPIDTYGIAYGIARVFFTIPIGWISFLITSALGLLVISSVKDKI